MHEPYLQTYTVRETHEVFRGIMATRDGKEVMSEYLGTDVAAGASGIRWWDAGANKRGLAYYGCVILHAAGGDRVFHPDEIAHGDASSDLPALPIEQPPTLNEVNGDGIVDFDSYSSDKCDAYAVLYEVRDYPQFTSLEERQAFLHKQVNGKEPEPVPEPVPLVEVLDYPDFDTMSSAKLNVWAAEHDVEGYNPKSKVAIKRLMLMSYVGSRHPAS